MDGAAHYIGLLYDGGWCLLLRWQSPSPRDHKMQNLSSVCLVLEDANPREVCGGQTGA